MAFKDHAVFASDVRNIMGNSNAGESVIRAAAFGVAPEGVHGRDCAVIESGMTMLDRASTFKVTADDWSNPLDRADRNIVEASNYITMGASPDHPLVKPYDSGFRFGKKSIAELKAAKPELRETIELALRYSTQDFTVFEVARTLEQQKKYMAAGTTRTMKSKHLTQADGFSHAGDLVPWIGGFPKWDWEGCYRIACAMDKAATELGHAEHIRWGAVWDRVLADFGGDILEYKKECLAYQARHPGKDFVDGPHFEWVE
jgi:peptidoglycan L-alanyl-D-glutamate endopeptidase CwlK